jgi:hypothetical protein
MYAQVGKSLYLFVAANNPRRQDLANTSKIWSTHSAILRLPRQRSSIFRPAVGILWFLPFCLDFANVLRACISSGQSAWWR